MKRKAGILLTLWVFVSLCTCIALPQGHACCQAMGQIFHSKVASHSSCDAQHACCQAPPMAALQASQVQLLSISEPPPLAHRLATILSLKAEISPWKLLFANAFLPDKQAMRYRDFCVLLN